MQKEQRQLDVLLASAMIQLIDQQPLFYRVLRSLPKIWTDRLETLGGIGIEKTTDQICILLNSTRLMQAKPFEIKIVLEHILHHLIMRHFSEQRINSGHLLHLATDYIINQTCSDFKEVLPYIKFGKGIFKNLGHPRDLSHIHGVNIHSLENASSYELCTLISNDKEKDWSQIDTIDDHRPYLIEGTISKRQLQMTEVDEQFISDKVKEFVRSAAKELKSGNYGDLPGDLEMAIKKIVGLPEVSYGYLMRQFVRTVKENGENDKTWTRVNRRYGFNSRGKSRKRSSRIVVILDTSGSIWAESSFNKFLVEMSALRSVCEDLWIVGGDIAECLRINLKSKSLRAEMLKFRGGGGTNLQFGFSAALDLKANGIFTFTDGDIPPFNDFGIPTLILLTPDGKAVPGYHNIQLERLK
jgi:predicted metal-dependent peptidase